MRIAIDYDGTIADTNRVKADWILQNLGQVVAPWNCDRTNCVPIIGESAYQIMGDVVYERESTLADRAKFRVLSRRSVYWRRRPRSSLSPRGRQGAWLLPASGSA